MRTLYGIQYLRAAAAIAVVLFHAAERTGGHFGIGAAGVDVFFVISGFVMWLVSERRPVTPGRFLTDRIVRIVPTYWLATAVMVFGAFAGLFPNLSLSIGHLLGSLLFIPVASPSSGEVWPVLVQGWTLNYEMFFYAIFALALLLPKRKRLPALALTFASLVAAGMALQPDDPLLRTYTRPIILEFVAGMALGRFWTEGRVPPPPIGAALVILAIAGFAAIEFFRLPFDEWNCGPLAIALVLGVLSLEAKARLRLLPPLAFLGDASYSIYLWHTFAVSVVAKFAARFELAAPAAFALACVLGILAGVAAYVLVERPLLTASRGRRNRAAATSAALTAEGRS
ncbi:acyltransferase family protein [Mycoplana dimorpha]|uniref:Exopolysaccharide production protein ExoZ n=1 Tax=Mycoplana dimorpha TaxID=28320 RepID=A0A2T5BDW7_MYCDI|nr:acyltransferase [Mycoplana dimorpha]PTM97158.1 exopolysaccharide production protein ExoZ [Mycoplana dimorpha]